MYPRKLKHPLLAVIFALCLIPTLWLTASAVNGISKDKNVEVNWDSLDLSEDQRQQLNQMDQQWKTSVQELAPRIESNQRKLKLMINKSEPDEAQVMELQQQVHQDKLKLKMRATKIFLNKRRVLNSDQQDKLNRMMNWH